jgi:hypothetical protein
MEIGRSHNFLLFSFWSVHSKFTCVDRPIERKLSNQQIASPPPNYEDVTRDGQDNLHNDRSIFYFGCFNFLAE